MATRLSDYTERLEELAAGATPTEADRRVLHELSLYTAAQKLLTTGDLAAHFGVTKNTIKAWIDLNLIPTATWAETRYLMPFQAIADLEARFAETSRRNREHDFALPQSPRGRRKLRAF